MGTEPGLSLESLLGALAPNTRVIGRRDRAIASIEIDSRAVRPGALFVALRGQQTDGHHFIAQAAARGAAAIVIEELCKVPAGATTIVVPDSARALSQLADAFYGTPSRDLRIAGVTGTNGKTTATQMAAAILNQAGIPCGTIGTIGARFGDREWQLGNTTPLASELQALLAQLRELGAKGVAMEVSSHALALQRVADVRFAIAALTNVSRDHLDFHKTFEAYACAKRRLFDAAASCVFNLDDEHGECWTREFREIKPVTTYALDRPADLSPDSIKVGPDGSRFRLDGTMFEVRIPGRFNVSNALCAIAIARAAGVADADSARGLCALERVPGRMDRVSAAGIDVIVDYAHTPDALANVLRTLRAAAHHRLLVVFGCGGDRDRGKRPEMGAVAARYADFSYVTSDNPRGEDPQAIIAEILAGMSHAAHAAQADRREAISRAIREANAGDVVLIAGKGHETYQIAGGDVLPFDDLAVARAALARRENRAR